MRSFAVVGFALVLAAFAGPDVFAFQEQNAPATPATPQAQSESPKAEPLPGAGLSEDAAVTTGDKGTEISIPGLGKLGVLPKMDFGLELLYGAAEQTGAVGPVEQEATPDDLMIRGTVKHRF